MGGGLVIEVEGHTMLSYRLLVVMLQIAKVVKTTSFLDAGCGTGETMVLASLLTECLARGIEIRPDLTRISMERPPKWIGLLTLRDLVGNMYLLQAQELMKRRLGRVTALQGDFLTSPEALEWIATADVILINNHCFGSSCTSLAHWPFAHSLSSDMTLLAVNYQLQTKLMELQLRDGVKIISIKKVALYRREMNVRKVGLGSLLRVEEYGYPAIGKKERPYVSWASSAGVWYLQTVDRSRVNAWAATNPVAVETP